MSLYTAETRRLVKRRFTRLFVLGAVVVLALIAAAVFLTNHKLGPDEMAAAQVRAQSEYQQVVAQMAEEKQRCEAAKGTADAGKYPSDCAEISAPTPDQFEAAQFLPPTFDFREQFPNLVVALAALLALVAFVVGASFVGAEWNSGGMMNLLLWRPQRIRVLATKLAALLVGLAALTTALSAAWTGFFVLVARLRGTSATMTSGAWQSVLLTELRGLALVLVAATVGFGLASIGRHTAMALGVAIGVVIVFQFGLGTVLAMAKVKFAEAYLLPLWMIAWMRQKYEVQDYNSCDYSHFNGCEPPTFIITWQMAGTALAAIFVLVVMTTMWTIRKRDIT